MKEGAMTPLEIAGRYMEIVNGGELV